MDFTPVCGCCQPQVVTAQVFFGINLLLRK